MRLDHVVSKHIIAVRPHDPVAIFDQRIRDLESVISRCGKVVDMRPRSTQRRVAILADPASKPFSDVQRIVRLQAAGCSNNDDLVADFL